MVKHLISSNKLFLVFLAGTICLLILLGGYLYLRYERNVIRNEKYDQIKTISHLKIDEITSWRNERMGDAKVIYKNTFIAKGVEQLLSNGKDAALKNYILEMLTVTRTHYKYENIFITTPGGREIIFSVDPKLTRIDPVTRSYIADAENLKNVHFTDLYYCNFHREIHYDIIVPVMNSSGISIATLVFRIDPNDFLYPLIQSWPTPSKTSEILIVRKNGDSVLFLNELRHQHHTALTLQFPLTNMTIPAVQAVMGKEGIWEGKDYRGVDVLACLSKVPGTTWYMVAKVDRDEIFADLNYRAGLIMILIITLIILTIVIISRFYMFRQRNLYKELFRNEKILSETREEFETMLYSIGDGVIMTDTSGSIRHMNRVAEKLTGWKEADAAGKSLAEVFRIVDEKTGDKVDIPVEFVVKKGQVTGIADQSMVISITGKVTPVAGNFAPIIHEHQQVTGVVLVFRDQTAKREAIKKLFISEVRYRRLFESTKEGILLVDAGNGMIIDVNPFLIEMLGYAHDQYLGKQLWDMVFFKNIADNRDRFKEMQENEYVRFEDIVFESAGGRMIDVEFVSNRYQVDDKNVIQCTLRDISKRKQSEEKLRLANLELERSNKELEQFAYVASHDLQEPLRMISSFTQLLFKRYNNVIGKDADDFIHFIVDGTNRMQRLIQDLLSYSRINTRTGDLRPVDSHMALGEAVSYLQLLIKESGAIITSDNLPVIMADFGQIIQVFQNLIGNAIKFRAQEDPRIHVSATPGEGEWIFSVSDNGIGIEKPYFDRIFIIFQRLHAGAKYPGTGIGLAICNRIIHRHEGRIWVESEPGTGSVFYFTIKN